MTNEEMFERLRAPFPIDRISWRVGATTADKGRGMAVCYIDARDVMDRLDDACTPAGWQCTYPHANGKTVCEIGIKLDGEWIWKSDGAGDTDREAEKGALSDAFKRAAVRWGIGRYLYDIPAAWVEIEAQGKSFRVKDSELRRLQGTLGSSAPRRDPPAPTPAADLATKFAFIDARTAAINRFSDYDALGAWWNSEAESSARREAGLTVDDIRALKEIVLAKREQLQKVKRRAANGTDARIEERV